MTDEERTEILRTQKEQQQECCKNDNREKEMIEQTQWDQQMHNVARLAQLKGRQIERKQRVLNEQLQTENMHLANEQKCYKDYVDNVVFTNRPTAEYFNQFNKSSR